LDAALVAVQPRELDRGLVRLGAGVAEEGVLHAREAADLLGGALLLGDAEEVGGVDELARLLAQRAREHRMGMAQAVHRDAGEAIEVLAALGVPQPATLAARERHRQRRIGVHEVRCAHLRSPFMAIRTPQTTTAARRPPPPGTGWIRYGRCRAP